MLKLTSVLVLSALSFAAQAADLLTASAAPPAMSIGYVTEGAACPGPGATGFATSGLLLSCQSGVWETQFKSEPETMQLAWYNPVGANTYRFCPSGYFVLQSMAQASPSGQSLCSTINGKDSNGNNYAMTRAACSAYNGETFWYHEITCAKFN